MNAVNAGIIISVKVVVDMAALVEEDMLLSRKISHELELLLLTLLLLLMEIMLLLLLLLQHEQVWVYVVRMQGWHPNR